MSRALPRSTPSAQGVDPGGVDAFLDALDTAHGVEMHSLMVLRHGHVVAEGWWHPYTPDRVHLLYSVSKSFASAAAGLGVAEGLLDVDATVLSYLPELDATVDDARSRAMHVRDLLAMSSGHLAETRDEAFAGEDPVLTFLRIPPDRDPGTVFAYNQPCTYTLAAIVQRLTGSTLTEYLQPRLFGPLGIDIGAWQQRPAGRDIGYSGLHLTTEGVARFGQLLLDGGRWRGGQVLPEGWVELATREWVPTSSSPSEAGAADGDDWSRGYGWQFWRCSHGYRADGAYGQFCLVVPEHDLVVTTTGATPEMQAVLDAVWQHLLPALGRGPAAASPDDDRLASRLRALALPPVPAGDVTAAGVDAGALRLGPHAGHGIQGAELRRDGAGWSLALSAADGQVDADVGVGEWAVTDPGDGTAPVAVSAGWPGGAEVVVDAVLLESPHRLRLSGDLAGGALFAEWHTEPLGDVSLVSMQRPLAEARTERP